MPENTKTPDYEAISKISKNLKVTNVEEWNPDDILGKLGWEYRILTSINETMPENSPENTDIPWQWDEWITTMPENTLNIPETQPENSPEDTAPPGQGD
jgi:hypothetical protein